MTVRYHSRFLKVFEKLPPGIQEKFFARLRLFQREPFHPLLNNHSVDAAYPKWRSINVTGDYRALFEQITDDTVVFMKIGTHSELYG
jgi:mRNA-degrading endonuclease YafQ of YafQ-DinJ toxin-antitoxin module